MRMSLEKVFLHVTTEDIATPDAILTEVAHE
jgi:hypothetical protein